VAVRWGVPMCDVAELLRRNASTLQESVERMRRRDPRGLSAAAAAIGEAVRSAEACAPTQRSGSEQPDGEAPADESGEPEKPDFPSEDD
jgi:hypothetical protein